MSDQALQKTATRSPDIITTQEEYSAARARWRDQFNMLSPFESIAGMAPHHGIIATQVRIDPRPGRGGPEEVYDGLPFLKEDDVAISKVGLRKIAEALGISTQLIEVPAAGPHSPGTWVDHERKIYRWKYRAVATYRAIDGSTITREAEKTWDLSNGSPTMKGWTQNQISEGRKHGDRACQARAINAAIKECGVGIKQSYTRKELARPFVAIRVMYQANLSNPAIEQLYAESYLRGTAALFAGARPAPPALPSAGEVLEQHEPRPVAGTVVGPVVAETSSPSGSSSTAPADAPPVDGAVKVARVVPKTKEKETGTVRWYVVVDSAGVERSTFDKSLADAADAFAKEGAWVEIDEERKGDFLNITGIQRAGAQPTLDGLDPSDT